MSNDGDKCEVFFVEGQVKHATYGSLVGDAAVFKVLRWTGGNFQLDFEGKTDKETTQLNTQGLLMEGLRLLDESARDGGGEPEPAAAPVQAAPSVGDLASRAGRRGRRPARWIALCAIHRRGDNGERLLLSRRAPGSVGTCGR